MFKDGHNDRSTRFVRPQVYRSIGAKILRTFFDGTERKGASYLLKRNPIHELFNFGKILFNLKIRKKEKNRCGRWYILWHDLSTVNYSWKEDVPIFACGNSHGDFRYTLLAWLPASPSVQTLDISSSRHDLLATLNAKSHIKKESETIPEILAGVENSFDIHLFITTQCLQYPP